MAEDLVQLALVRVYRAWSKRSLDNVDAFARRVLVNLVVDHRRRPGARREQAWALPPELSAAEAAVIAIDGDLLRALAGLPPQMRAAVVLRHVEGLSVEQTAEALGCSQGNVKSQSSRGLEKLRQSITESTASANDHVRPKGETLCKS